MKKIALAVLAMLSLATIPNAHAWGVVFDPINWIENSSTAIHSVLSEERQVQQYITQLHQYEVQVWNVISLPEQAQNATILNIDSQIEQYNTYKQELSDLYGGLNSETNYMQNLGSMFSASHDKSWADWFNRESYLAHQGNNQAQALFSNGSAIMDQVNADIDRRQALAAQMNTTQGVHQAVETTGDLLQSIANENDQMLELYAMQAKENGSNELVKSEKTGETAQELNNDLNNIASGNKAYSNSLTNSASVWGQSSGTSGTGGGGGGLINAILGTGKNR